MLNNRPPARINFFKFGHRVDRPHIDADAVPLQFRHRFIGQGARGDLSKSVVGAEMEHEKYAGEAEGEP